MTPSIIMIDSANNQDTLRFTDINYDEVTIRTRGDNLFLIINDGSVITLKDFFKGVVKVEDLFKDRDYELQKVEFADGTIWPLGSLILSHSVYVADDGRTLNGTANDDLIISSGYHHILVGGKGDDYLEGGQGRDTYVYAKGDGNDTIYNYDSAASDVDSFGNQDTLRFTDINYDEVIVSKNNDDLRLTIDDGSIITIKGFFRGKGYELERIQFADGKVWTADELNALAHPINGTSGNDNLYGGLGNDAIRGLAGNDYIDGKRGNDYLYGGTGRDIIYGGDNDDTLYGGTGQDRLVGGRNDDTLYGGDGNDYLYGGSGSDSLYGDDNDDTLSGGTGNDTYIYAKGDGHDTIDNYDTGNNNQDTLRFTDVNADDVKVSKNGHNLLLTIDDSSIITIKDFFKGSNYELQKVQFADGEIWDTNELIALSHTIHGTSGNDNLYGGVSSDAIRGLVGNDYLYGGRGNDYLYGNKGNDTLRGDIDDDTLIGGSDDDYLNGGGGNDTYLYARGDGNDVINNYDSGSNNQDTLRFLKGINADHVKLSRSGNDLKLTVILSGVITIRHFFYSSVWELQRVEFADGEVWDTDDLKRFARAINGTQEWDNLIGTDSNDVLRGLSGYDHLYGGKGDDWLYGGGGGDWLYGGDNNDYLYGGKGNDKLYGDER